MRLAPADEDDRLAKAALYTKYVELLPAALMAGHPCSLRLVADLLNGIKTVVASNVVSHQNLFRYTLKVTERLSMPEQCLARSYRASVTGSTFSSLPPLSGSLQICQLCVHSLLHPAGQDCTCAPTICCLCRSAECFVQIVNLLNFEYTGSEGLQLSELVLGTLAALLRGNDASRRRLESDVGYDQIQMAIKRQVCMPQLQTWCNSRLQEARQGSEERRAYSAVSLSSVLCRCPLSSHCRAFFWLS